MKYLKEVLKWTAPIAVGAATGAIIYNVLPDKTLSQYLGRACYSGFWGTIAAGVSYIPVILSIKKEQTEENRIICEALEAIKRGEESAFVRYLSGVCEIREEEARRILEEEDKEGKNFEYDPLERILEIKGYLEDFRESQRKDLRACKIIYMLEKVIREEQDLERNLERGFRRRVERFRREEISELAQKLGSVA